MRRTLVGVRPQAVRAGGTAALPQQAHLAAQRGELLGEFQHRLVLFGHVPLQVGDLLLKACDVFVQR